jgi:hypothetical protein
VAKLGNNLTAEQREHLCRLRWLWDKGYQIDCDGDEWTAHPRADWDNALTGATHLELWEKLKIDNARRIVQRERTGYWVETCSGPPYFVDTSHRQMRHGNSGPPDAGQDQGEGS